MKSFGQRYQAAFMAMQSFLCVGLDPEFSHAPEVFGKTFVGMEEYLKKVIDIAATKVPVIKPQYAYYGADDPEQVKLMIKLIEYAKSKGLIVTLDGKRANFSSKRKNRAHAN